MNHVLIVDDKEENLYYLQSLLNGNGCSVDTARHGAEALVRARQHPPDLVIADLLMPVMDGFTLLRHWKADERLKRIPFIVYTATYIEPADEQLAMSLGADAFILKPAEPEDFLARIREVRTRVAQPGAPPANQPVGEEKELLKIYSETLIRKLEEKSLQLEETNRVLERDIAERRRMEVKLRLSEETQRHLAETQLAILNALPAHIALVDAAGLIVSVNESWRRFATANALQGPAFGMGQNYLEVCERAGGDCSTETPAAARGIRQVLQGEIREFAIEYPCHSATEQRWFRLMVTPLREDRRLGAVVMHQDITKRRQLEEQFRQSQKMEAIGQLAAGVAHDFNNILTAILGNSQLALADIGEGHPARESLEQIKSSSIRATSLVQQILAFSRQQAQERRVIEPGPILQETARFLRATIPSVVELVLSIEADVPPVLADSTQFHQVVTNLCTNAWQALEDRPGRIDIKLQAVTLDAPATSQLAGLKPGRVACLTVTDTGKGMDAATLERIFDPFFTTKEPGKGTGLGLSVVHGIVQGHDGAITVTSQPGRGTTFQVYFPAATGPVEAAAPASEPPGGAGQHILYLDDEEALVFLAERMLERLGYRVSGFIRAAEAIEAFRENPGQFELIITDLNMPGTSGLNFAAEILKLQASMPVVLCSGHVTEDLRQRAKAMGIREVLYKPNTLDELSKAIHRLAAQARQP